MKKVAGKLRLSLAQFRELQAFVQFATDVDEGTKKKILQGQKINEVLKQDDLVPVPFEEQVCVFYAVLNNFFENVSVADIKKTENDLIENLEKLHEEDILKPIRESGQFDEAVEAKLKEAPHETSREIINFMASAQNLKRRIKSVTNIGTITKAMELVAATKMRRSQELAHRITALFLCRA